MTDPERHVEIRIVHPSHPGEPLLLVDSRTLHDLVRFGDLPGDDQGWIPLDTQEAWRAGCIVQVRPVLLEAELLEDVGCSRCQETTPRCRCREVYGVEPPC